MPPISVRVAKRAIDIALSSLGLAVSLPLLPLCALAIRLDSDGPIFYRQRRAGTLLPRRPGERVPRFREFVMYKLRTMRLDAERGHGAVLASEDDPRVTRLGRFLRKTRLDELPQLWNVLRGDMSLVGPRPERPDIFADLVMAIPFFEERMRDAKPGITGVAQVSLGYTGKILEGSELWALRTALQNPFELEEAAGALADDMRAKLLYDLAYVAALEDLRTYLETELRVVLRTPFVMVMALGR